MLLKSLPLSHRLSIFLATMFTVSPLLKWMQGKPFRFGWMLPVVIFWAVASYDWVSRHHPAWQPGSDLLGYSPGLIDRFGQKFDQMPASAKIGYWLVVALAAVLIYLAV